MVARNFLCLKCLKIKSSDVFNHQICCNHRMKMIHHNEALFLGKKNNRTKRFKQLQDYWETKKKLPNHVFISIEDCLSNKYMYDKGKYMYKDKWKK